MFSELWSNKTFVSWVEFGWVLARKVLPFWFCWNYFDFWLFLTFLLLFFCPLLTTPGTCGRSELLCRPHSFPVPTLNWAAQTESAAARRNALWTICSDPCQANLAGNHTDNILEITSLLFVIVFLCNDLSEQTTKRHTQTGCGHQNSLQEKSSHICRHFNVLLIQVIMLS